MAQYSMRRFLSLSPHRASQSPTFNPPIPGSVFARLCSHIVPLFSLVLTLFNFVLALFPILLILFPFVLALLPSVLASALEL